MQKVEIEVPEFEEWEFDGYRTLKPGEDKNVRVFFDFLGDEHFLNPITSPIISPNHKYFFYKKKPQGEIIYKEVRADQSKMRRFIS